MHQFSSGIHPTVFITNHTFTNEGVWLRQPGSPTSITVTPDEQAMKALGDAMAAATGWQSELGWTLGEITGATEDWNYFAQGTYGYTPGGARPELPRQLRRHGRRASTSATRATPASASARRS